MGNAYIFSFILGMNLFPLICYIVAIALRKKKVAPWILGGIGMIFGLFGIIGSFNTVEPAYLAAGALLLFLILTVLTLIFLIIGHKKAKEEEE